MKKIIWSTIGIVVFTFFTSGVVFTQGMPAPYRSETSGVGMSNTITSSDGHTAREETEGKAIWEKLQTKELTCKDLSDDNFGMLGEYFMGQMMGDSHEAMNNMMIKMMGEEGEEQMHVVMGKRLSGCEPNAPMPQNMPALSGVEGMDNGMMPMMMNMMMGGGNSMMGNFGTNPTSWFGWGFSWVLMILFWGFIILGIIALIKWIVNADKHIVRSKSALDILKERYAKSEIDKKEFEDKKKDLI